MPNTRTSKRKESFSLIEGFFDGAQSKEILNNLYHDKIQFHQLKNFSSKEKTGKSDKESLNRIKVLKSNLKRIEKFIHKTKKSNAVIYIKADIVLSIKHA